MGTAREDSTGRPLSGVEVLIPGTDRHAVTDGAGRYVLGTLARGNYVMLFRLVGFAPVRQSLRIVGGDTVRVNALLVPSALPLPPIEVTAAPKQPRGIGFEAFEERRRMGFGKFIDSTALRRLESLTVADVLRRYTSVTLLHGPHGELWAQSTRKQARRLGDRCWMQVILDGNIIFRPEWDDLPRPIPLRPDFNRDFPVADFEAIEVYHSAAETPVEFSGTSAACGTIVLWTRRALKP